ncbi:hypothetical protein Tco_0217617 [Tanacetum coccineum]
MAAARVRQKGEKVREVAYKLELPEELSTVHNTFHVSNLKKCYADEPLAVPLDGLHFDDKLQFVEEPVEIVDREVKRLKQIRIPLVKVRWNSKRGPEFTWECEGQFRKKYPHLFTKTAPSYHDTRSISIGAGYIGDLFWDVMLKDMVALCFGNIMCGDQDLWIKSTLSKSGCSCRISSFRSVEYHFPAVGGCREFRRYWFGGEVCLDLQADLQLDWGGAVARRCLAWMSLLDLYEVMAISVISVSSDSSEDSVGTPAGRVWICQILQEISQKRTRERMSDQEAKEIKAEAREIMPQPSTKSTAASTVNLQSQHHSL